MWKRITSIEKKRNQLIKWKKKQMKQISYVLVICFIHIKST